MQTTLGKTNKEVEKKNVEEKSLSYLSKQVVFPSKYGRMNSNYN